MNMNSSVKVKNFGVENPTEKFYVIWRKSGKAGFFSNIFHVCAHLGMSEKLGFTPVIDMKNYPVYYNEKIQINNTTNSWEYYFEQPSTFSLDEVYKSKNVYLCDGEIIMDVYQHFKNFEYANSIIEKYIRIKPDILKWVNGFYDDFFRGSVLGIHFRGQDMKTAPYHYTPPTVAQMIDATKAMLKIYNIDRIFLVTEDQGYLKIFQKEFGCLLISTSAFRTYEGVNAYSMNPHPRNLHMYNLGLEVLKDMLLLSRVNYLLASGYEGLACGSNVSLMAQIFNNNRYQHVEIIYNGVNPELIAIKEPLKSVISFARKVKGKFL